MFQSVGRQTPRRGIWSIVGNNTPVCFIRDQMKHTFG
ncbi:catalase [Pseudomonas sp. NFX15]